MKCSGSRNPPWPAEAKKERSFTTTYAYRYTKYSQIRFLDFDWGDRKKVLTLCLTTIYAPFFSQNSKNDKKVGKPGSRHSGTCCRNNTNRYENETNRLYRCWSLWILRFWKYRTFAIFIRTFAIWKGSEAIATLQWKIRNVAYGKCLHLLRTWAGYSPRFTGKKRLGNTRFLSNVDAEKW